MAPGVHGLIAGQRGHKLRAAGREFGESTAGMAAGTGAAFGTAAGLHRVGVPGELAGTIGSEVGSGIAVAAGMHSVMGNQKKGRYKKQRSNALGLGGKKKPTAVIKAFRPEPVEKGLGSAFKVGADAVKGGLGALKIGASSQGAKLVAKKPVQAGIASFKATKLGVKPGPITANRAAAHVGIAAGHATTLGGAAAGTTGVLAGAGLMHQHDKSTLGKSWQEIAKAEWKTIHQREQAQGNNRRHARAVAEWGSLATTAGALQTVMGPKTQSDLHRMGESAGSGYRFRTKANQQLSSVKIAPMKGNRVGDIARGARAIRSTPKAAAGKTAAALMIGGVATAGGAHGVASARNAYHQHKINERRRVRMGRVLDSQ
jgi:hypothetical protein